MVLKRNVKYIAAVSGGPDSIALLHKYRKYIAIVCHVNYCKRADSNHDTKIVSDYCKQYHIPLKILVVKKSVYDNSDISNFQALARKIRYDFFEKVGKKYNINNVLVAHHFDDFLETAIMQENRKSLNFFYGIKPINYYKTLTIYRPLIKFTKKQIISYCHHKNLIYAIDSTNAQPMYERNCVRKKLQKHSFLWKYFKFWKIRCHNIKAYSKEKKAYKAFKAWQKSNYSIVVFKNFSNKIQDQILYLLFKQNNTNRININKINGLKTYILSSKAKSGFRLSNSMIFTKKNKCLILVKKTNHETKK